jgi:hypothetical protein
MRSAQDDGFVGVLKKNIQQQVGANGTTSWAKFSRHRSTGSAELDFRDGRSQQNSLTQIFCA